jgi:hypothetical protein
MPQIYILALSVGSSLDGTSTPQSSCDALECTASGLEDLRRPQSTEPVHIKLYASLLIGGHRAQQGAKASSRKCCIMATKGAGVHRGCTVLMGIHMLNDNQICSDVCCSCQESQVRAVTFKRASPALLMA